MPERLDRVTVTVPMGAHSISWDARETLLAKLEQKKTVAWLEQDAQDRGLESNPAAIRAAFEAVGASRPVVLSTDERDTLGWLLGSWSMKHEGVPDGTRLELLALCAALERGEPSESRVAEWDAWGPGVRPKSWHWTQWRERQSTDDHMHCEFCNTRFSERTAVDYDLTEGWCGFDEDDGYERWVCAGCFEKLHERFGWKADPSPAP